jgi:outer membrane murein-binding lipoprotein Lpp
MPARAALTAGAIIGALCLAGCSQPGKPASLSASKKLDEATNAISMSCGFAEQITAFGGPHAHGLERLQASAAAGARKLAAVYAHLPNDVYQGETVSQIVSDSASLLGDCGLSRAQRVLLRAHATQP